MLQHADTLRLGCAIWLESYELELSKFCVNRLLLCISPNKQNNKPQLQLPELSTFITGYEPRMSLAFAISLSAQQISHVQFQQVQIGEWVSCLILKSSLQMVPLLSESHKQSNNNQVKITRVLWKGRHWSHWSQSHRVVTFKSRSKRAKDKLKLWHKIKRRQQRKWNTRIEEKGHNMKAYADDNNSSKNTAIVKT